MSAPLRGDPILIVACWRGGSGLSVQHCGVLVLIGHRVALQRCPDLMKSTASAAPQLLYVRHPHPITPTVNQPAAIQGTGESLQPLHLNRTGPVTGLHLHQYYVRAANANDIEQPQAARRPGAGIARRLEQRHRAVFVAGAFAFGFYNAPRPW